MTDRRCGYAVTDRDGHEEPCDQPATGHRWYQDVEHEDLLDVACEIHENPGGYRMASAEADRDRARRWAVHLEQENAHLEATKDGMRVLADARLTVIREQAAELDRYHQEATAAHSVIEQVGLLQEHMATLGLTGAEALRQVLNGGRFEEVRRG